MAAKRAYQLSWLPLSSIHIYITIYFIIIFIIIYGAYIKIPKTTYEFSDDLILIKGDISGEIDCYGSNGLITGSDGTIIEIVYCKNIIGIWNVNVIKRGKFFDKIEICTNENAKIYSDIVYFKDGLEKLFFTTEWSTVD